jgi:hypothetical protein
MEAPSRSARPWRRDDEHLLLKLLLGGAPHDVDGAAAPRLFELAVSSGTTAHLLKRLTALRAPAPPGLQEAVPLLREHCFRNAVVNLEADRFMVELAERFDRAGLRYLVLKGSALRLRDPALGARPQCDVDLLLDRADIERAESVLHELGLKIDEKSLTRAEYLERHFNLRMKRGRLAVELHWDISNASAPDAMQRVWERAETIESGGRPWPVPHPAHAFLFSCVHLSRHTFLAALKWVADVYEEMPRDAETIALVRQEAVMWPHRLVATPLWFIDSCSPNVPAPLREPAPSPVHERALLRSILVAHAFLRPWHHVPLWLTEQAVHDWLYSSRGLSRLLLRHAVRRAWPGRGGHAERREPTPPVSVNLAERERSPAAGAEQGARRD